MKAVFTVLAVVLVAAVAVVSDAATGDAAPQNTSVDCTIPLNVECTVTDPDGIRKVEVCLQGPNGQVCGTLFDGGTSCPTSVDVGYDPINPTAKLIVTDCQKDIGGIGNGRSGDKTRRFNVRVDRDGDVRVAPSPGPGRAR